MDILYLICAALGGTLLVCQFVMSVVGIGDHHDVGGPDADLDHDVHHGDHGAGDDHSHSWFVGVLTFRTVVAGLTFFGLAGLAGLAREFPPLLTLLVAVAAGAGALFLVAFMMRGLHKLRAEGTVHIERSVGKHGTVYLRIPAERAGAGKVHLNLQNRTVEYQAVTNQVRDLPTGAKVVVLAVVSSDTVEVAPVEE
jgi:hypothetical protein